MKKLVSTVNMITFFGLVVLFSTSFSAFAAQNEQVEIRWASAGTGAALYPLSTAMVEDLKKNIPEVAPTSSAIPTSGPVGNIMLISEGKRANIGFSFSDLAGNAWIGEEPYKSKIRNFRNVATFYPQVFQWVVWADSGITKIQDLKGKRVSPFQKGLSAEFMARKVLAAYGMSYSDMKPSFLGFTDAGENMKDGHLDALLATTFFYPYPTFVEMASIKPIRLLTLDKDKIEKLVKENIGVHPFTLPANTYKGVNYPVPGIATRNHVIVREDMSEELVYKITKVLAENYNRYGSIIQSMKQITNKDMADDAGVPFHPGALKYYKERGWIK